MKSLLSMVLLGLLPFMVNSQDLAKLANLNDDIAQTSGLIFFDDRLITHNDSGGLNALYEINQDDGEINRTVSIQDATNIDWEDVCSDEAYIYIGDFGNNNGNRTNLRIYKVRKTDYLNSEEVNSEVIEFTYEDQIDFTSSPNNNNFDAEALISYGENLYIFTKNWIDQRTSIYKVPKNEGSFVAEKIDEFDAEGLITGGTFDPLAQKVILSGYTILGAFVIELQGFSNGKFSNGLIDKYNLNFPLTASFQTEAVTYSELSNHYFLSTEKNTLWSAALYSLDAITLGVNDLESNDNLIYPNPSSGLLTIETRIELDKIEIYTYLGEKVYEDTPGNKHIDISGFSKGLYILKLYSRNKTSSFKFLKQ